MDLWVNKYTPTKSTNLVGNGSAIKKLKEWLKSFTAKSKYKIALLVGQPGVGKTTCVNLLAKELGYKAIEYNASDNRSESTIKEEITDLTNNTSLDSFFGGNTAPKKNIIVMDESDGLTGGGMSQLIKLSKKSLYPIVCICNVETQTILKLNYVALKLKFSKIPTEDIEKYIVKILRLEGFTKIDESYLIEVIDFCDHDMRQILTFLQNKRLSTDKLVESADTSNNESNAKDPHEQTIFAMVNTIFKDIDEKNISYRN